MGGRRAGGCCTHISQTADTCMCVMLLCEHFIDDLYLGLVASRLELARPERPTRSSGSADISIWTESQAPTYRPNRFRDT